MPLLFGPAVVEYGREKEYDDYPNNAPDNDENDN